ncbi:MULTISPECIES: hypothetical protein [unclassified Novosphingobium]|uniref:hypothetical protein n=1 Tax=unclassified Novosphingobium TaxID=2644732 RepID=UPI0010BDF562|nr:MULTISPECIES: hypothetical protein [unclassified Novosphingobium]QCI96352.1 hypothetical protein FA702_22120 [Novosphingobium sp. EMRT-2]
MKLKFTAAMFVAALALPAAAHAAPCKDAKGKFIKCPPAAPAAAASHAAAAPAAAATHAAATTRRGPCRDAKTGRFKKC